LRQEGEGFLHQQGENEEQQQQPASDQQQQQPSAGEETTSQHVKNPPHAKPKGRPKLKEKRTNPFVVMQDEAKQKRRKKQNEPKKPQEPTPKRNLERRSARTVATRIVSL
jgi:hypothetical protein